MLWYVFNLNFPVDVDYLNFIFYDCPVLCIIISTVQRQKNELLIRLSFLRGDACIVFWKESPVSVIYNRGDCDRMTVYSGYNTQ